MTTNIDYSVMITDDPKNIYNKTTGRCTGVFLALPDGKFTGSGFCLRKDKGTWRSTAGTGKFAGKADSGWWQGAVTDGKMTVTRWGGNCN